MFTTLVLILSALLSPLNPTSLDWIELAERVGYVEPTDLEGATHASVQLDLLPDQASAQAMADALELALPDDSLEVFVEVVPGEVDLPPAYRVGIGPFSTFEEAEHARERAEQAGFEGFVRTSEVFAGC